MITIEKRLDIHPDYDFDQLAPRERIVFFDIETTGLGIAKASLYLIGTVSYEDGSWNLRQYFAENMLDEEALLQAFFRLINEKKKLGRVVLVSYNGDGFDLPFIRNCVRQYALGFDLTGTVSLDLLKKVRPYRKMLGLADCRLKTVESLCGICREDRYSGGELIYVYEEYLRLNALDPESCEQTPLNRKLRDRLLETLLLHNAEDIADMPMIMNVLGCESLFDGGYEITSSRVEDGVWDIHARLRMPLPKGVYEETPERTLSISEEDPYELNLAVPVLEDELKYFFVDYKNYYYLPAEDYAVHKSVGEFVDRRARRQATARTCYQKKQGRFVPQPAPVLTPLFYREYRGQAYGELPTVPGPKERDGAAAGTEPEERDGVAVDQALARKYLQAVLEQWKEQK